MIPCLPGRWAGVDRALANDVDQDPRTKGRGIDRMPRSLDPASEPGASIIRASYEDEHRPGRTSTRTCPRRWAPRRIILTMRMGRGEEMVRMSSGPYPNRSPAHPHRRPGVRGKYFPPMTGPGSSTHVPPSPAFRRLQARTRSRVPASCREGLCRPPRVRAPPSVAHTFHDPAPALAGLLVGGEG